MMSRAAGHGHFRRTGGQHHGGQQVLAVRRLFLHAVQDVVQRLGVLLDAVGQVDLVLGAGIDRAAGVVQHAIAHRAVGGFLRLGVDRGVDVDALGVGLFLEHAVHQLARQLGRVVAVDGEAARAGAFGATHDHALLEGFLGLLGRQVAQRLHAVQHIVLADLGAREIGDRIEARRRLWECRPAWRPRPASLPTAACPGRCARRPRSRRRGGPGRSGSCRAPGSRPC